MIPLSEYKRRDTEDSRTQKKIANLLIGMGYMIHQNEVIGIYSVDFLLKPKLVLEYHGVNHYYLNNQEMLKEDQVKVRALRNMGY